MRKAVITKADSPLLVTTCEVPSTPAGGVRVKVTHGGICHTDLHFIKDKVHLGDGVYSIRSNALTKRGFKFEGITPGHEIGGTVDEIGSGVAHGDLKVGDRVVVYPWIGCEDCTTCQHGFNNICDESFSGTTDYGLGPNDGGYGSYTVVKDPKFVFKIPDEIPMQLACILPCSALTGYGAIAKAEQFIQHALAMRGKARLMVIGAGGLGLWAIKFGSHIFANKNVEIVAADISEEKLKLAEEGGASRLLLWGRDDDQATLVAKTTDNGSHKMDVVVDFVGLESTIHAATQVINKAGAFLIIGQAGTKIKVPSTFITFNALTIQGSRTGPLTMLRELIDLVAAKNITYPCIEEVSLDDINNTLDRLKKGQVKGRAVVKHD